MLKKFLRKIGVDIKTVSERDEEYAEKLNGDKLRMLKNPILDDDSFYAIMKNPIRKKSAVLKGKIWFVCECVSQSQGKFIWHTNYRLVKSSLGVQSIKKTDVLMPGEISELNGLINDFMINRGEGDVKIYVDSFATYADKPLSEFELEALKFYGDL